jgi:hypothetical protein
LAIIQWEDDQELGQGGTLLALAKKLGVPREVVAYLEAGKIEFPADLIEHVALALGRRLRDFAEE